MLTTDGVDICMINLRTGVSPNRLLCDFIEEAEVKGLQEARLASKKATSKPPGSYP
jgi:hypothetical protein|tara:strand:+ start:272 stop:439 length:168 start_codon:yes stop_codon:yes gene_type:complete